MVQLPLAALSIPSAGRLSDIYCSALIMDGDATGTASGSAAAVSWTEEQQTRFQHLKMCLPAARSCQRGRGSEHGSHLNNTEPHYCSQVRVWQLTVGFNNLGRFMTEARFDQQIRDVQHHLWRYFFCFQAECLCFLYSYKYLESVPDQWRRTILNRCHVLIHEEIQVLKKLNNN